MKYFIDGQEVTEKQLLKCLVDGVYQGYNNGQLSYELNYLNGQAHGLQRRWYVNGQLGNEENYLNGQEHGLQRYWYSNGQLACEHNYLNGQEHGLQRRWNDNGQLKYEQIFVNDKDRTNDLKNNKLAQVVIFGKVICEPEMGRD